MKLYQYGFGYQPHYVVAASFGQAEQLIREAGYGEPDKIECLGNYVLLPHPNLTGGAS